MDKNVPGISYPALRALGSTCDLLPATRAPFREFLYG